MGRQAVFWVGLSEAHMCPNVSLSCKILISAGGGVGWTCEQEAPGSGQERWVARLAPAGGELRGGREGRSPGVPASGQLIFRSTCAPFAPGSSRLCAQGPPGRQEPQYVFQPGG